MPEMKRFLVTQTREVEVTANDITSAVRIADAAFENGQDSNGRVKRTFDIHNVFGDTNSRITIVDVRAHDLRPSHA